MLSNNSFYSRNELNKIGFASLGKNVFISKKASIYGAHKMSIGNNVRIDDFCVLSGKIDLGDYVHIAVYTALFGGRSGIIMEDFSCLSSRCAVYAKSDDYSGEYMTNPMIDDQYLNICDEQVVIKRHVVIGTGSTILPGVTVGEGASVGSMSLINKSLEPWGIYLGIPCKYYRERSKNLIKLEKQFLETQRTKR